MESKRSLGPAATRLRQIALVAHNLERQKHLLVRTHFRVHETVADQFQTHVLGTEVIYEDPAVAQWGLKNFIGA